LAKSKDSLGKTLDSLPAALKVLNDNRSNIVDAFTALRSFAGVASHVLSETKSDFAATSRTSTVIKALQRPCRRLGQGICHSFRRSRSIPGTSATRSAVTNERVRDVRPDASAPG